MWITLLRRTNALNRQKRSVGWTFSLGVTNIIIGRGAWGLRYRFGTLQQSLFAYYSAVFIIFSLIVAGLLYVFLANDIRHRSEEQQKQLGVSIVGNLDQEVVKMNNFSMNIVYSNLVKEHFSHYLAPAEDSEQTLTSDPALYKDTTTLIDVILAIISGSIQPSRPISMM